MDGCPLGCPEGYSVGLKVEVGLLVLGALVGFDDVVGVDVGQLVGWKLGDNEGSMVGEAEGLIVGIAVDGTAVGEKLGAVCVLTNAPVLMDVRSANLVTVMGGTNSMPIGWATMSTCLNNRNPIGRRLNVNTWSAERSSACGPSLLSVLQAMTMPMRDGLTLLQVMFDVPHTRTWS